MGTQQSAGDITMKSTYFLIALAGISWAACSTTNHTHDGSAKGDPETVLVSYHVKPGEEAKFQSILSEAWQIYRTENLVFAKPHIIVRDSEDGGKARFVELFTWVSHSAPEHVPDSIKALWQQEQSLCEPRGGRGGIEGGEVEILTGK